MLGQQKNLGKKVVLNNLKTSDDDESIRCYIRCIM